MEAEDGIRDSVASRGLGDVYKRNVREVDGDRQIGLELFSRGAHRQRADDPAVDQQPVVGLNRGKGAGYGAAGDD